MLKRYTRPRVQKCCVPTTAVLGREGPREIGPIIKYVYLGGRKGGGEEWTPERHYSIQASSSLKVKKDNTEGLFKCILPLTPKN